jgi:hypothetical protein
MNFLEAKDAEKALEFVKASAAANMVVNGRVDPLVLLFTDTEVVPMIPDLSSLEAEKHTDKIVNEVANRLDAWSIVMVGEAWLIQGRPGEMPDDVLARDADRAEGVVARLSLPSGGGLVATAEIKPAKAGRRLVWGENFILPLPGPKPTQPMGVA